MPDEDATHLNSPDGAPASGGRQALAEVLGDRYRVVKKLGAGAFGEVYEADDTTLGRAVAIKRIRLDLLADGPELEEVKQRFLHEARVAARLRHPNVVTIHDIAAKGQSSFMVMERVLGQTLQDVLRDRGRLPLAETLRILAQAAAALDFAHGQGVIHRDVKPANLMIEPSGQLKVMDFGIAKGPSSGNLTRTGTIMGTPNYMAPEQAKGSQVDGRADLFSLGCVLYECLSGRRPFVGDNVTAILLKIVNEPPPSIDWGALELPASLEGVLKRALAKDPKDRYASGQGLVEAAEAASRGLVPAEAASRSAAMEAPLTLKAPVVLDPAPASPPVSPVPLVSPAPRPRSTGRAVVVVALAVLLLGGGLWAAYAGSRPGGANAGTRVSRFVMREDPSLVGRLFGATSKLHLTVPEGTSLRFRLEAALDSDSAQAGQEFAATSSAALAVDGHEAFPAGSRLKGHVSHAAGSGKVSGRGELTLELDRIVAPDGREMPIEAEPIARKARSTAKKDGAKVAAAAGAGALLGGLLGGGKGAAIGTAVGGGGAAGAVLATKGEEVVLPRGTALDTRLRAPVTVTVLARPQ